MFYGGARIETYCKSLNNQNYQYCGPKEAYLGSYKKKTSQKVGGIMEKQTETEHGDWAYIGEYRIVASILAQVHGTIMV